MRTRMIAGLLLAAPPAGAGLAARPASATTVPAPAVAPGAQSGLAEQRIQALQTALRITPAQMPRWSAFAQAMRDNATTTDALFRQRAGDAGTLNAVDNMKSYATVARAYADDTQTLSDAFQTLYGSLSEPQRQIADRLFLQQAARR